MDKELKHLFNINQGTDVKKTKLKEDKFHLKNRKKNII